MIREATKEDLPALLEMGLKFHAMSGHPMGFDGDAVSAFMISLIDNEAGCLLMTDKGAIGGVLAPAWCDPEWLMAIELFWWAEGGGLKLMSEFEKWAESRGANEARMTSLAAHHRAADLLQLKGYAPSEISFSKVK